ncbi:MAG: nucleotidyltransferase domain-containing protein [Planctomycetota bacterium]|jgi:hypothetical protein|nr:nucleotidyltransferase domain-containing protein [Planctomycetota bacterium]
MAAFDTCDIVERLSIEDCAGILSKQGARFAYVFGSRADGTAGDESDIDLAVYFDGGDPTDRFRRSSEIQIEIQRLFPVPVEVVVLNDATPVLRFEAMRPSKVIYCTDEDFRLRRELRWFREYEEYTYRQDQYMKILAEELEESA